jgi:hypothetical protein
VSRLGASDPVWGWPDPDPKATDPARHRAAEVVSGFCGQKPELQLDVLFPFL